MQLSTACMICLLKHQEKFIEHCPDEVLKAAFMQEALRMVGSASKDVSAPYMTAMLNDLHKRYFGFGEDMSALKHDYNQRMMRLSPAIEEKILGAKDPVLAAIQYARAGNYIDFGAMESVDDEKLQEILDSAHKEPVDETEYRAFLSDLSKSRRLLLVTDNAGEIVMDKLLLRAIHRAYPSLSLTALVRGSLTSNDATREDAREIGLEEVAHVIDNGTDIAGTEIAFISEEARNALCEADVIVAKGQGNFETLMGCGLNVYYIFLNKCDWFMKRFGKSRFSGMFVNDRRITLTKYL